MHQDTLDMGFVGLFIDLTKKQQQKINIECKLHTSMWLHTHMNWKKFPYVIELDWIELNIY